MHATHPAETVSAQLPRCVPNARHLRTHTVLHSRRPTITDPAGSRLAHRSEHAGPRCPHEPPSMSACPEMSRGVSKSSRGMRRQGVIVGRRSLHPKHPRSVAEPPEQVVMPSAVGGLLVSLTRVAAMSASVVGVGGTPPIDCRPRTSFPSGGCPGRSPWPTGNGGSDKSGRISPHKLTHKLTSRHICLS